MQTYSFFSRDKIEPVKQQGVPPVRDPGENPPGQNAAAPTGECPVPTSHAAHPPFHSRNPEWEWEQDHLQEGLKYAATKLEVGAEKVKETLDRTVRKLSAGLGDSSSIGEGPPPAGA